MTSYAYYPSDWLATKTNARQRRMIATWLVIIYVSTLPMRWFFKDDIWMVWLLSEFAIIISLLTVVAAETPTETE